LDAETALLLNTLVAIETETTEVIDGTTEDHLQETTDVMTTEEMTTEETIIVVMTEVHEANSALRETQNTVVLLRIFPQTAAGKISKTISVKLETFALSTFALAVVTNRTLASWSSNDWTI